MKTYFISGHLSVTPEEFSTHYAPKIDQALSENASFVLGDARGADKLAQDYLLGKTNQVVVYHMFDKPRNNAGFPTKGGFKGDDERDACMTQDSDDDIAWVRPGRQNSGTQQNLNRRKKQ